MLKVHTVPLNLTLLYYQYCCMIKRLITQHLLCEVVGQAVPLLSKIRHQSGARSHKSVRAWAQSNLNNTLELSNELPKWYEYDRDEHPTKSVGSSITLSYDTRFRPRRQCANACKIRHHTALSPSGLWSDSTEVYHQDCCNASILSLYTVEL